MDNFIVILLLSLLSNGVFGADEKSQGTEGDNLTLPTGLTKIQSSDQILWLYGSDKTIIAKIVGGNYITDVDDERFKGNLKLDKQTGSLTIENIRIKNSGLYQLDINRGTTSRKFDVTVYAHLPTPDIESPQCSLTPVGSHSRKCVFSCSVQTSGQATLSWYKGNVFISSKVSDICSTISLPLEANYEDRNIYSCLVSNPISNKTQHLNITQLCQPCQVMLDSEDGVTSKETVISVHV
ncbi:CD48 antigen-like [Pseudorasbora parva]|uniref:CD48 antigen-like n=1 Tax=Pseudorasbora parva TaxID=51549 RepID=UPI00351E5EF1